MNSARVFFWSALAFMLGTVFAALLPNLIFIVLLSALGAACFLIRAVWLNRPKIFIALFWPAVIIGAFYYNFYPAGLNYSLSASRLVDFKYKIEANIESVLDRQKAAFLNGLILGERQKFSK